MKLWDFIMLKLKASFETLKAEYEAHESNNNAHNVDRFIEKDATNSFSTNNTFLEHGLSSGAGISLFLNLQREKVNSDLIRNRGFYQKTKDLGKSFINANIEHYINYSQHEGSNKVGEIGKIVLFKNVSQEKTFYRFTCRNNVGGMICSTEIYVDYIDLKNHHLKDLANGVDGTLEGTPRVAEIKIGDAIYYFKVYPTKTIPK